MAEYIEREAALSICETEYRDRLRMGDYCGDTVAWNIGGAIKALSAADVAPVVRCKDCKYHDLGQEPRRGESLGYCIIMGAMSPDEGFCYLAKRGQRNGKI